MESAIDITFDQDIQESFKDNFISSFEDMKSLKSNISSEKFNFNFEDSTSYAKNLFKERDVILNESWDFSENIQGKIVAKDNDTISIDCLIDIKTKSFQYRSFPIHLFNNIDNLSEGKPVIIKTKIKKGSIRIDVYPGIGIVNEKLFKIRDNWASLKNAKLDEKLTEW